MSDASLMTDLLALPAYLLFHVAWIAHSVRRPLLLVSALCVLSNPRAAIYKLKLTYTSLLYLLLSKDKKWKVPKDRNPSSYFTADLGGSASPSYAAENGVRYRSKTVILVRHGESTWNDTFNAGDRNKALFVLLFLPNLIYAIVVELYFFVSGKGSDSWFFDSALSKKGVGQGEGLRKFLRKERMRLGSSSGGGGGGGAMKDEERAVKLLLALGEEGDPSSHVVSSNLRRAISTAAIGLADRFAATAVNGKSGKKDDIILIPALQEISRNPDALSILHPGGPVHPTWCDVDIDGLPSGAFSGLVDARYHEGNKSLKSNGLIRLNQFCNDVFDSKKLPKDVVIAAGHSLFYRSIFQVYLPRETEHISKKKKLVNGGTVMVTLREATMRDGTREYMIDPRSVVVIYGGFGKHTKG